MGKTTKTGPSKRKRGEPREEEPSFDADKFKSAEHEKWYQDVVKDKEFNPERAFDLSTNEVPAITSMLRDKGWLPFNSLIKKANQSLVREFYANAYRAPGEAKTWYSFVRGKKVCYAPETINEMLLGLSRISSCGMRKRNLVPKDLIDYEEILRKLCRPGAQWINSSDGFPSRLRNKDMHPIAKAWSSFFHQNIESCSNSSEVNVKRANAILAIVNGEGLDLGNIISESIVKIANSSSAQLGHASLIYALCKKKKCAERTDDVFFKSRGSITAAWIRKQPDRSIDGPALPDAVQVTTPSPQQQSASQSHQQAIHDPSFHYELLMANWCGMQMLCEHQGLNISFLATPHVADAAQQFMAQCRAAATPDPSSSATDQQQDAQDPLLHGDAYIEHQISSTRAG